ncbi:MAG: glutamyl-tRNA reductase [Chlamydiia bacterium]|nr:glutamyl-tRNA reductase [Chlamydiia bacterium]
MQAGVVGISHKTADLSLRELIAPAAHALEGEKARFFPYPTVLLSTCNRIEIYFSSPHLAGAHTDLLAFLRRGIEIPFEHRLYSYFHADCFAHLTRVATGLDSAILAETEILRQVKVSYAKAANTLSLPSCLHYIFQKAFKIAKSVRTRFALERGAPHLYSMLYEIAASYWEGLEQKKILFVGNSDLNRGLISFLARKNIHRFVLATRRPETVCLEGVTACNRKILKHWSEFDWIICASQADEALISGTSTGRHLIFDLSVPRNVDPALADLPNVRLFNIEMLNQQIEEKRKLQGDCLMESEQLLVEQVIRCCSLYRHKHEKMLQLAHV